MQISSASEALGEVQSAEAFFGDTSSTLSREGTVL